jgi:hypothetical protein
MDRETSAFIKGIFTVLGIIVFGAIIIAVSGCVSSNGRDNPADPKAPQYVTATPTPGA